MLFFFLKIQTGSVYQFLCSFLQVFSLWGNIALYNSSYIYLAPVFENGPQVNKKQSFFSIDVLIFPYIHFLIILLPFNALRVNDKLLITGHKNDSCFEEVIRMPVAITDRLGTVSFSLGEQQILWTCLQNKSSYFKNLMRESKMLICLYSL